MNDIAPDPAPTPAIEVGPILETLRAEVRARRLSSASPAEDAIQQEIQRALDEIELHRVVSAHWPLIGHTLPQRVMAVINKLVRRYLRWYINPIVEQQNAYNDTVARTLRLLAESYADLAAQVAQPAPPTPAAPPPSGGSSPAPDAAQLQRLVAQRAAAEPPAPLPDIELRAQLPQLRLRQGVLAHWPLPASTLPQRAVALLNKLVRQYLRWYINPIVEQQNAANAAITQGLASFVRLDAERRGSAAQARAASRRA